MEIFASSTTTGTNARTARTGTAGTNATAGTSCDTTPSTTTDTTGTSIDVHMYGVRSLAILAVGLCIFYGIFKDKKQVQPQQDTPQKETK